MAGSTLSQQIESTGEETQDFADDISYRRASVSGQSGSTSLIKAGNVKCSGVQRIEVNSGEPGLPTILTKTENGTIVELEFRCPCGCTSTVALEYGPD